MAGKVHVPPSKERYYQAHPVISFRASREDYEALKKVLETSGKSIGQFFREALGTAQRDTRIAYKKGREIGRKKGFRKAKNLYRVHTFCPICGEQIPVRGEELTEKAGETIWNSVPMWCHRKCKPAGWPENECELIDR
jgi:hypothetical protein